jgi:RNA polymerase sigma factor (sigma-70 family)
MKDYKVTIKVRNARLINALAEVGESVGGKLANKMGVSYHQLLDLSNLKMSPLDEEGKLLPIVEKLCDLTNKTLFELFTVDQIAPLETNKAEFEMDVQEVQELLLERSSEDLYIEKQTNEAVHDLMDSLTPRENQILKLRYGVKTTTDYTLGEVGEVFGVSAARVRQIEAKALRKMRHPSRSDRLRNTWLGIDFPEKKKEKDESKL